MCKIPEDYWKRKRKKRQYYYERNEDLSEDQKQKLIGYRRTYCLTQKINFWVAQ